MKKNLFLMFCFLARALFAYESDCQVEFEEIGLPKFNIFGVTVSAFDIDSETIWLWRTDAPRKIDFSSDGVSGPTVLKSSDLDFGSEFGYRLALQLFLDNDDYVEISYMDVGQWTETKKRSSDTDNLFSVFSLFGTDPAGGYPDTDQAFFNKIKAKSELYSFEAAYWRHLACFKLCDTGYAKSYAIGGYRYFKLEETFLFKTITDAGSMNYHTDTLNSLHGLELGYGVNAPLSCQWEVGFEAKGAIYSLNAKQRTKIALGALTHPIKESKDSTHATWGVDGRLKASYEVIPNWFLRCGYQLFYLNCVAKAVDNFNSESFFEGPRKPKLKQDSAAWQGLYFGIEVCL